jgi:SAM-dependent methyltransferase
MNQANNYFETILLPPLRQHDSYFETLRTEPNPAIERLVELREKYARIADLGCGSGERTIALMLRLQAVKIVAIDKEQSKIDQVFATMVAQRLEPIQQQVQRIRQIFDSDDQIISRLSEGIKAEAEYYVEEYGNIPTPDYRLGDITKGKDSTGLQGSYYDLAYCQSVLYHIYCDERGTSHVNTRLAIQEMARICRSGGLVVAYEPNVCSQDDDTPVELRQLFEEREELRFVDQVIFESNTAHIYRRK